MTKISPPPPLKRLGQHFLVDPNIVRKILSEAAIRPEETVFEIGPGRGILTTPLCHAANRVMAVEIDQKLVTYLRSVCSPSNLELYLDDALQFPYETLPDGVVVVANLPYYVSTPLLFKLFECRSRINRMVLMLQFEVARRLTANPGTRDYGALSAVAQYCAKVRLAFKIPATCFHPRPEVDSAVVSITLPKNNKNNETVDEHFFRTVRGAFAHRRKTVMNSLREAGFPANILQSAFSDVNIDPRRRAETLTLQELMDLSRALQRQSFG